MNRYSISAFVRIRLSIRSDGNTWFFSSNYINNLRNSLELTTNFSDSQSRLLSGKLLYLIFEKIDIAGNNVKYVNPTSRRFTYIAPVAPKPVPKPVPKPAPKPVPKPAPKPAPKPGPRRCAATNKYCKVDDLSISSIRFDPDVSKTYIAFKNGNPDQVVRIYDDLKKIRNIYVTQEGQFFAIGLDSNKFVYPIERNSSGFYIKYFILSRSSVDTGFEEIAGQDKIKVGGRFKALLTINNEDRLRNNTYTTTAVTTDSNTVSKVNRLMDGTRTTYTFQRGGSSSKTAKKKGIIKKNRTEKHKVYN
jgi:hypothetical protein